VRENPVFKRAVERNCWIPAAKRREIAAQGASPGWKWETSKPWRGERQVLTLALQPLDFFGRLSHIVAYDCGANPLPHLKSPKQDFQDGPPLAARAFTPWS